MPVTLGAIQSLEPTNTANVVAITHKLRRGQLYDGGRRGGKRRSHLGERSYQVGWSYYKSKSQSRAYRLAERTDVDNPVAPV